MSLPESLPVPAEVIPVEPLIPTVEPVRAATDDRLPALDLLRGIAILAILVANIPFFATAASFGGNPPKPDENVFWGDKLAIGFTHLFVDGKFITMLSILFGAGLAIQSERAQARKRPFIGYYLRRLALLFALGLIHGLLLWFGDILTSYAVVGVLALFASMLGLRGLRWCIAASLGVAYFMMIVLVLLMAVFGENLMNPSWQQRSGSPSKEREQKVEKFFEEQFTPEGLQKVYGEGPYWKQLVNRLIFVMSYAFIFPFGPCWYILGCFLIGVYLLRLGVFHDLEAHRPLLRRFLWFGFGLGIPLQIGYAVIDVLQPNSPVGILCWSFGALPMALGYIGLFALWCHSGRLQWLQRPLRAEGRMALTNYLLQTVICTTLFYSYGFGLYSTMGRAQLLLVVAAVWAFELALSPVWLRYFHMGPVEWVWRSLAEGRRKPFLRTAPMAVA